MASEIRRTFCRLCEPACGLLATVEDGELTRLMPDREHPLTHGYACHKGLYALEVHRDPDRLNQPLRRNGDAFEPVSWATAIDDIGARLRGILERHGSDAVAGYLGNPGEYNSQLPEAWYAFFAQLGASRLFNVNTQDCGNKFSAAEQVYGSVTIHPIPDFDHTRLLLLIGENPKVSQMSFCSVADPIAVLKGIEARGGRVVLVNPRRVETLQHVGELLQVKPDTDVYLLAALLCELERQGAWREDVLARHGRNVDALREVVRGFPASRVAPIVGLEAGVIETLARDFAAAGAASVHVSTGVNMGRQGTLAYWLAQMLVFVTGNLDRPGGNALSVGYYTRRARAGRAPEGPLEFLDTPFGPLRKPRPPVFPLPGTLLADFITRSDSPIRALVVCAGNPVLSVAGEHRLREALSQLELLVVIDLYRSDTARDAHYVLPATDAFERADINGLAVGLQHRPGIQYTPAVVAPRHERRHERWMLNRLAEALGIQPGAEEGAAWGKVDHMLRSRGHSFAELERNGAIDFGPLTTGTFYQELLQTPDQRVDCCPQAFAPALTRLETIFTALAAEPAGLKLISKREPRQMNSWLANVATLKTARHQTNHLYVHPDDALAHGLTEGALALIRSAHGELRVPVKLSPDLRPGVVALPHGWGHAGDGALSVAARTAGVNANRLLPSGVGSFEPLSGQAHMTGIPVTISAC